MLLYLSPPFSNYALFHLKNVIPILGTFTVHKQPGKYTQILNTMRYSSCHNGWINKVGLCNNGIDTGIQKIRKNKIISIYMSSEKDKDYMLSRIPSKTKIEINMSYHSLSSMKMSSLEIFPSYFTDPIIKLSPTTPIYDITQLYDMGFNNFHCSGTLPTLRGDLSGPSLIPYNIKIIQYLRYIERCDKPINIIAGGGVQSFDDINCYKDCGANDISISTLCINPYKLYRLINQYYDTIDRGTGT